MIFDEIYRQYHLLVFNLALHYTQNVEDAEEIAQDVFLKVYQNLLKFNNNATVKTWLYRITINQSLDFIKRKNAKKRINKIVGLFLPNSNEPVFKISDFNHPGLAMEQKEALERIFRYINELPANQQTVVLLNKIEGNTVAEIAEIMQISYKAVESLLQRAKNNLATKINASEGDK